MRLGLLHHLVLALLLAYAAGGIVPASAGGSWKLLQSSVGVSGMHMQLLHNDRLILFDRTNFGPSNLTFPPGHPCRVNPQDVALPRGDCTAHSVEYSVASNTFRALSIFTDTWCSSGHVAPDGTLVQNGGWQDGTRKVRVMPACSDGATTCDWTEKSSPDPEVLAVGRWYATNQKLPDGRAIVVGGLNQFNYEFLPKSAGPPGVFALPFLSQTNSLYPFVHLNIDGNLFIFAKNRAVLFDYKSGTVVRSYAMLGDGTELRSNPNAGSSVLLPLKPNPTEAEVLICGGTPAGAVGRFPPALKTCGRLKITDANPSWVIEEMPSPRVMGDMILLPNGEVAIINGATDGLGGWEAANTPSTTPIIYRPDLPFVIPTGRFEAQTPTGTPRPRMYHSSAVLLRDGRVLVGGSNPHHYYNFTNVKFPTDLSLEAFSPYYLDVSKDLRPFMVDPSPKGRPTTVTYGGSLDLLCRIPDRSVVSVTMVAPSFTTHSFAQNQRQLFLQVQVSKAQLEAPPGVRVPDDAYVASVTMPATPVLAPPGYYMLFVVNGRIPSEGIWVHIQ
ncbi:aldehyde oxidase GLOX-like [Miscanthus floridulus]|uniref:aldehyde oxidase GLOX-like n=1 Tax=Miscanthus floridulus TaxID=154761 RepID=UPI00345A1F75